MTADWRCRNPYPLGWGLFLPCDDQTGGKPGTLHRYCGWDDQSDKDDNYFGLALLVDTDNTGPEPF